MEILAQPLCETLLPLDPTVFTPTTFRHTKRLRIRISKPSHKKFHFKKEALKSGEIKWCCTVRTCTAKLYTVGEKEERLISRKFTDHNHQYNEQKLQRQFISVTAK
jgi:hypothetical protein